MARTIRQQKDDYKAELAEFKLAVKKNCIDCLNDQQIDCQMPECPLFKWRRYRDKQTSTK